MEKRTPGAKKSLELSENFEKILTSLQAKLPAEGLPQRLTLEQQGKFILGYYHQTQKRYEKKGEE